MLAWPTPTVPRRDAISLPALLFFRSYNEVFVQTAFIPYYLSTDIGFACVLCTSSSSAVVASLSLPLSLSVFVQGYLTQQYCHFSTYNEVVVQTAFIPYFPSGAYYFSICDHGPDSLHAVICDKLTFSPLTDAQKVQAPSDFSLNNNSATVTTTNIRSEVVPPARRKP